MSTRITLLSGLIVGVACAGTAFGQLPNMGGMPPRQPMGHHTLSGRIYMPDGNPGQQSFRLKLTSNGNPIIQQLTDDQGRYTFMNLYNQPYEITIEGDGELYETTRAATAVFAMENSPERYTFNITLTGKVLKIVTAPSVISADDLDRHVPGAARKEFEKGLKSASDQKYDDAIRHLEQAIAIYPTFYAANAALGTVFSDTHRYNDAVGSFRKALAQNEGYGPAIVGLGVSLARSGNYSDALPWLRKAVSLHHRSSVVLLFLGLSELKTGQLDAAEVDLLKGYQIGRDPAAHVYLGSVYERRGDFERAATELRAYLAERPNASNAAEMRHDIERLQSEARAR